MRHFESDQHCNYLGHTYLGAITRSSCLSAIFDCVSHFECYVTITNSIVFQINKKIICKDLHRSHILSCNRQVPLLLYILVCRPFFILCQSFWILCDYNSILQPHSSMYADLEMVRTHFHEVCCCNWYRRWADINPLICIIGPWTCITQNLKWVT